MEERIARYLRLSLEDGDISKRPQKVESNSIGSQRALISRYIAQHADLANLSVEEFCDDGFTGTNFDRPQFQCMLQKIKDGEINCVIVKDLSRFGRNYLEVGDYLEHIFPFLRVRFISVNDNYDSKDYAGKTSGMDIAFKNLIHQKYSQDLSEKVKTSMHMKMKKGKYITHCPYGYMKISGVKHRMIPDPQTAPIVREIFEAAISGRKSTEIAASLNSRGILTPEAYKKVKRKKDVSSTVMWSHQSVLRILHDIKYTGTMVNFKCENAEIRARVQRKIPKEDWVTIENAHDAIVSMEEYEQANDSLRKVAKHEVTRHDQSDRVFVCGHCGRKLRKTFGSDEYFSCCTQLYQKDAPCSCISLRKSAIEEVLLEVYKKQLLLLKKKKRKLAAKNSQSDTYYRPQQELRALSQKIKACEEEKLRQYETYRSGDISKESFLQAKEALSERVAALRSHQDQIQQELDTKMGQLESAHEQLVRIDSVVSNASADGDLISHMYSDIDRVTVFSNDEIEIQWKFEDLFTPEEKIKINEAV